MEIMDTLCQPGFAAKPCEDIWGHSASAAIEAVWVMDGATGLSAETLVAGPGQSDVSWFVRTVNDALQAALQEEEGKAAAPDARPALLLAMQEAARQYALRAGSLPQPVSAGPVSTLVLLSRRPGQDEVVCASLGDSTLLLETRDGFAVMESDPVLVALDAQLKARLLQMEDFNPSSLDEARRQVMPELRAARALVNTPQGYWMLDLGGQGVLAQIRLGHFRMDPGAHALLLSDGFFALCDDYGLYTPRDLLAAAREKGLAELYRELRTLENGDPLGKRFPRFKTSDDATAVLVRL